MKQKYLVSLVLWSIAVFSASGQWHIYNGSMVPHEHPLAFEVSDTLNISNTEFTSMHSTSDGMLTYLLPPASEGQRAMWKHTLADTLPSTTIITKVRTISDTLDKTLDIAIQFGNITEQIQIQNDNTIHFHSGDGGTVDLPAGFSTTDWHTYRITADTNTKVINVYLDEADTVFASSAALEDNHGQYDLRFGLADSSASLGYEMDYLTWNGWGAYAPDEEANPMASPAGYHIAFVEGNGRDHIQRVFLEKQGFNINVLEPVELASAESSYYRALNTADLVIISRSNNSGYYRDANATAWKDSITTPVIVNAQYLLRGDQARMDWFEVANPYHANVEPDTAYAQIANPNDTIFSFVNFSDSIPWMHAPHDLLELHDSATNGTIAASFREQDALIVHNEGGSPLYDGGPTPAASRIYFGFGNDNTDFDNFFPLTQEAQQVYFNMISWLTRLEMRPVKTVERSLPPASIAFVQSDDREDRQIEFLEQQGYEVTVVENEPLSEAGQDYLATLNNADLVIIGRSPNSGNFRGDDAVVWKDITSPVVLNNPYIANFGPERINWFEEAYAYHANVTPDLVYAQVTNPNDTIFSFVHFTDSIPWMHVPHDLLILDDTATNGNVAGRFREQDALIVQNEAGNPLYEDGPSPAGPRTYFGFGNDNTGFDNFFPLTNEAQQVYFNELQRLLGREMKEVTPVTRTLPPALIVLVQADGRDLRQQEFLEANGYNVMVVNSVPLAEASQTFINDTLNAASLIIIGPSVNSGNYRAQNAEAWKEITTPVILNDVYLVTDGRNRMNWFEVSTAFHMNEEPDTAYARITDPDDPLFTHVSFNDSIPWCFAPHDFIFVPDTATNGNIAARWEEDNALIVQNEADSALYDGGPSAAAPRTFFCFGNDNTGFDNFFPLTDEAQQVYYNEIQRLLGQPMQEVVTVEPTEPPPSHTVSVAANPAHGGSVTGGGEYDEGKSVTVTATANFNYEFVNWTENGFVVSANAIYNFNMGPSDRHLTAHFNPLPVQYTLILETDPTAGGTVAGGGDYEAGESVTVVAMPINGYEFVNWTNNGNGVSTSTNYTFNMPAEDHTLTAHFQLPPPTYTITLKKEPAGGGTVTGAGNYEEGEPITVMATAGQGYAFANWTENGNIISTDASYSFTVGAENRTLTANFTLLPVKYTLTLETNPVAGGTVQGFGEYEEGQPVTATASANEGYAFVHWTDNGNIVSTDTSYAFDMEAAHKKLTAHFEPVPVYYTLSLEVEPSESGTVTGDGEYLEGETVTATAVANAGYTFVNWTYAGGQLSTDNQYQFPMTTLDITLTAHFEEDSGVHTGTTAASTIQVYPNPVKNTLTIKGLSEKAVVRLYNSVGEVMAVYEQVSEGDQLNMSDLQNGMYIIRIESKEQVVTLRLIK